MIKRFVYKDGKFYKIGVIEIDLGLDINIERTPYNFKDLEPVEENPEPDQGHCMKWIFEGCESIEDTKEALHDIGLAECLICDQLTVWDGTNENLCESCGSLNRILPSHYLDLMGDLQ